MGSLAWVVSIGITAVLVNQCLLIWSASATTQGARLLCGWIAVGVTCCAVCVLVLASFFATAASVVDMATQAQPTAPTMTRGK